jgi:hypothetical protein
MNTRASDSSYRRELGDGLVARWSTAADLPGVQHVYSTVFRDGADDPPNVLAAHWAADMMSGRHPLIGPGDFALVEDTRTGTIVAATCLLWQVWDYEGIAFQVGRPEAVANEGAYRERGLIRAAFELLHARSAAQGQLAQAITGIPYYYRQFGYEYALDLGGGRSVFLEAIPALEEGRAEPYVLRDATAADIPRVLALYDRERARGLVSAQLPAEYLRWTMEGQDVESGEGWRTQLIAPADGGEPVGYLLMRRRRWGRAAGVPAIGFEPGVPLQAALPSVLRALAPQARATLGWGPKVQPANQLLFQLGREHPVYQALDAKLIATYDPPYAWYVRVPDLPGFIRHVQPVLERRLAGSVAAGFSGELRLDFYRGGLRLAFEQGRLAAAEPWNVRAQQWGPRPNGGFPPLVFLQLLFGHRSLAELRHAFPDVWAGEDARPVLEALFPARPSWVLPLD